jgi:hypothetical protein
MQMRFLDYAIWSWVAYFLARATIDLTRLILILRRQPLEFVEDDRTFWQQVADACKAIKAEDGYVLIPYVF